MENLSRRRIVSLLPSATEIVVALGLGEQLVGRSHECDFPGWVEVLPACTRTRLRQDIGSGALDTRVREILEQGLSPYEVEAELLRRLDPDIILTQSQCEVCAVTPEDLDVALCEWTGRRPSILSLAPAFLDDLWSDIERVAAAAGAPDLAPTLVASLKDRLARVAALPRTGPAPRVVAIEWIEPLMVAGNWVPELISTAGGEPLLAEEGKHSPWTDWDQILAADPDIVILMPCGFGLDQILAEFDRLSAQPQWASLRAVREHRAFAVDGRHFFNRPGPRLVQSAEILAEIFAAPRSLPGKGSNDWLQLPSPGGAAA